MSNLEKSPGMCSDRPETTPKSHDLVVSPTCLREKEREPFGGLVRVSGGKRNGHIYISQFWLTPLFCAGADCPRYPGGPSDSEIFDTDTRLELPLVNSSQHRRTVRVPLADRPQCNFAAENNSAKHLVNKSHKRRNVHQLPADCLLYQISDSPEFCQLSQFQLQFGIIAHIKIQKISKFA